MPPRTFRSAICLSTYNITSNCSISKSFSSRRAAIFCCNIKTSSSSSLSNASSSSESACEIFSCHIDHPPRFKELLKAKLRAIDQTGLTEETSKPMEFGRSSLLTCNSFLMSKVVHQKIEQNVSSTAMKYSQNLPRSFSFC